MEPIIRVLPADSTDKQIQDAMMELADDLLAAGAKHTRVERTATPRGVQLTGTDVTEQAEASANL